MDGAVLAEVPVAGAREDEEVFCLEEVVVGMRSVEAWMAVVRGGGSWRRKAKGAKGMVFGCWYLRNSTQ